MKYDLGYRIAVLLLAASGLSACAGPATPMGAIWSLSLPSAENRTLSFLTKTHTSLAQIQFSPRRQVLHGARPLRITIDDPSGIPDDFKLSIRFNGYDVTPAVLKQAEVVRRNENRTLELKIPQLRLLPSWDNQIEVSYGHDETYDVQARYESPSCDAFKNQFVATTESFEIEAEFLRKIARVSKDRGFSPAFSTALIAQESGFNPRAVSRSKAIGLTQVTSLAETEMSKLMPQWPRYPGINELPFPVVKGLVVAGQVNPENEWRLDTEKSIWGGLTFAKYLSGRWKSPENLEKLRAIYGEIPESLHTQLVLASYNSGYSRVLQAVNERGRDWLNSPELRAAKTYVNRIFSFCDHFSNPEIPHENEA
jgi:hypothetical protein